MKVSLNWLKQYVDLPKNLSPEELALKLTMATVEVEAVIDQRKHFQNMVIGEIAEIKDHPDADKLKVCQVKAGSPRSRSGEAGDKYQVVCGGSNIYQGMKGILALPGAMVKWHGQGELVTLEKTKIRGVQSEGMLCSASEVDLAGMFNDKEGEVVELKEGKAGQWLAEVLGYDDVIFEIDNKSITHRPDLWGHYGIAREVAAILGLKLKDLELANYQEGSQVDLKIKIEDKENCSRYLGAALGNIKIEPSPAWLQNLLKAVGVRPINNIVDITNYVTLELGRPSHAFDRRNIQGDTIIVRRAQEGEKFITLDGQERKLTSSMCLVSDAKRAVDLGGIMGGENSEIKDDTTEIILELANFNPANIRKTASALDLRTEAAVRFEKGLAPSLAELGLKRILTLIFQIIPGARLASKVVDVNYDADQKREISLPLDFLNRRLGQVIPKKEVVKILESLSFAVQDQGEVLLVAPPLFRTKKDIAIPEDLVEEVARLYGFDNLTPQMPHVSLEPPVDNLELNLERKIKDILTQGCGATEVYNYSFIGQKNLDILGMAAAGHWELKNYFSEEQKYLRVSLFENLIANLEDNLRFFDQFNIFELGRVYLKEKGEYGVGPSTSLGMSKEFLAQQPKVLSGLMVGDGPEIFLKAKGLAETLLSGLSVSYDYNGQLKNPESWLEGARTLALMSGNESLGLIGLFDGRVLAKLGLNKTVAVWQLSLGGLLKFSRDNKKYRPLPKYPGMIYDFSVIVPQKVSWAEIRKTVGEVSALIRRAELFDVYQIKALGPDKKSMAFHVYLLDEKKTLNAGEAGSIKEKIVSLLKKKFNAEIR